MSNYRETKNTIEKKYDVEMWLFLSTAKCSTMTIQYNQNIGINMLK